LLPFSSTRAAWLAGLSAAAVAGASAERADGQALTPITVACGLVEPHAAARYAAAQGFFRKHGLDAQILTQNNGAANAAAVVGGAAQFGISNILQLSQAHANNVSFKVVALGEVIDAKEPHSGLIVSGNGGIASVRDLSGKTIAVSSPRGLDQLETANFIDKQGGDSQSVRFLEMPPTASVAAVTENRIAAAVAVPPMLETALGNGMRSLGDIEGSIAPLWVPSGWFSTAEYVQNNADIVRRFIAAIYEAGAWALTNRSAAADVLSKALGSPVPRTYLRLATKTDPALFQPPLDVAAHYGYVVPTKATDLMWSGA
jgi:NitT/TauT family transport system substrate-binding protein